MSKIKDYLSSEEFDLLFEDEIDALDLDYQYEQWTLQKEAMETDYQYCK